MTPLQSRSIAGGIGGAESVATGSQQFLSESQATSERIGGLLGVSADLRSGASQDRANAALAGSISTLASSFIST